MKKSRVLMAAFAMVFAGAAAFATDYLPVASRIRVNAGTASPNKVLDVPCSGTSFDCTVQVYDTRVSGFVTRIAYQDAAATIPLKSNSASPVATIPQSQFQLP